MRTVIGVDPSFTCTGVAVWQEGRVATFHIRTEPKHGPRVVRERMIAKEVYRWISYEPGQTLAVVEAVHLSRQKVGRTSLDLAGLHDVLVYGFHARGIPVGVARPQCGKILATGKGNASKADMVHACADEFGLTVTNDDEADAAWLMAAGVVSGGGTVNGWPPTWDKARAAQLRKIQWVGLLPGPDWLGAQDNVARCDDVR